MSRQAQEEFIEQMGNPHLVHPVRPGHWDVACNCRQGPIGALVATNATIEWPRGFTVTRVEPDATVTLYATDCGTLSTFVTFTITNSAGTVVGTYVADTDYWLGVLAKHVARYDNALMPHTEGFYTLTVQPERGAIGTSQFEVNKDAQSGKPGPDYVKYITYGLLGLAAVTGVYLLVNYAQRRK